MRKAFLFLSIISAFLIATPAPIMAQEEVQLSQDPLIVDLSSDHIDVSVGFSGSEMVLFGDRRDKDSDVAIVVEGPERAITVWKKARFFGTWINRHFVRFNKTPVYYNYALSNPDLIVQSPDLGKKYRIGVPQMMATQSIKKSGGVDNVDEFKQFLIKRRVASGNFSEKSADIKFLSDNFFKVSFKIPPSVPTGDYKISSFLIKDGQVIEAKSRILSVEQVGVNAFVLKASRDNAFLYSIFCIVFAALSGWVVSIIRVRI